jgi:hypothetical protein
MVAGIQVEYSPLDILHLLGVGVARPVARRASSGMATIGWPAGDGADVLKEADEHPHVFLTLLLWFIGGKGYLCLRCCLAIAIVVGAPSRSSSS